MNDTPEEKFKYYCDQLLQNVADELNVKEVRLNIASKPKIDVVLKWDTLELKSNGFEVQVDGKVKEAPDTLNIALVNMFTGNILEDMEKVRDIVNKGLNQRSEGKI